MITQSVEMSQKYSRHLAAQMNRNGCTPTHWQWFNVFDIL